MRSLAIGLSILFAVGIWLSLPGGMRVPAGRSLPASAPPSRPDIKHARAPAGVLASPRPEQDFRLWCEKDSPAATAWALSLDADWPRREPLLTLAAAIWTARDWPGALAWVDASPESPAKNELRLAFGRELVRYAPREALRLAMDFPANSLRDGLLTSAVGEWATLEPRAAVAFAKTLPSGEVRDNAVASIATAWSEDDSLEATDLALNFLSPGDLQDRVLVSIVQRWSQRDPIAAAGIVSRLPDGELRDAGLDALVTLWGARHPTAVASWVDTLPAGPFREQAAAAAARRHLTARR